MGLENDCFWAVPHHWGTDDKPTFYDATAVKDFYKTAATTVGAMAADARVPVDDMAKLNPPDARLPDGSVQASPEEPAPLIPNLAKLNPPDARLPDGSVQASPEEPAPLIPSMLSAVGASSTSDSGLGPVLAASVVGAAVAMVVGFFVGRRYERKASGFAAI